MLVSCGDDEPKKPDQEQPTDPADPDNPDDPEEPAIPVMAIRATPYDMVVVSDCAGFKYEFTPNVSYFYATILTKEVAETTTDDALEEYLSNKNLPNKRLPDNDLVWSVSDIGPEREYVLCSRAYDHNDNPGDIVRYGFSTPSWTNAPNVVLYLNPESFELQKGQYSACFYFDTITSEAYYTYSKGQLIWYFYHNLKEYPSLYLVNNSMKLYYDNTDFNINSGFGIVAWAQGIDGKLSGDVNIWLIDRGGATLKAPLKNSKSLSPQLNL